MYQRSDLLHRTDDSQDNYNQPKQQAENGSSKCVHANAETHKTYTHTQIGICTQTLTYVRKNKAYRPLTESVRSYVRMPREESHA